VLFEKTNIASMEAHTKLIDTLQMFGNKTLEEMPADRSDGTDHFADLMLSIYMDPANVHQTDDQGQDEKYFVGLKEIKQKGKKFIVYAGGNASKYFLLISNFC